MAVSGISATQASVPMQQAVQPQGQHKHGRHSHSITDVDALGSSVASAPSPTGKVGSKLDVTA